MDDRAIQTSKEYKHAEPCKYTPSHTASKIRGNAPNVPKPEWLESWTKKKNGFWHNTVYRGSREKKAHQWSEDGILLASNKSLRSSCESACGAPGAVRSLGGCPHMRVKNSNAGSICLLSWPISNMSQSFPNECMCLKNSNELPPLGAEHSSGASGTSIPHLAMRPFPLTHDRAIFLCQLCPHGMASLVLRIWRRPRHGLMNWYLFGYIPLPIWCTCERAMISAEGRLNRFFWSPKRLDVAQGAKFCSSEPQSYERVVGTRRVVTMFRIYASLAWWTVRPKLGMGSCSVSKWQRHVAQTFQRREILPPTVACPCSTCRIEYHPRGLLSTALPKSVARLQCGALGPSLTDAQRSGRSGLHWQRVWNPRCYTLCDYTNRLALRILFI